MSDDEKLSVIGSKTSNFSAGEQFQGLISEAEEFFGKRKIQGLGIFLLALLIAVLFWFSNLQTAVFQEANSGPSIEGKIVNVTLTDTRPEPFRPTISPEDGVRFTNNAQYSYNFSFESERLEGFVIEPGESRVVDVTSIAYYTAEPLNSSARDVKGGVNVDY